MNPQRGPLDKASGAYYTEERVAEALCRWALRRPGEAVLDPAFGGGVFLAAASRRLAALGAGSLVPTEGAGAATACDGRIFGVELDPAVHAHADSLTAPTAGPVPAAGAPGSRLLAGDFFSIAPSDLPRMDAVVGNPPFIRFQRFAGRARERAAERARQAGVEFAPLAGSWVAFVAHATSFLAPGGRLALIVPAELGHAPYARPLIELIGRSFAAATLVSFRRSLFPHLDQETLLLLADGWGSGPGTLTALELAGPAALAEPLPRRGTIPVDRQALVTGTTSLTRELLEPVTRAIYDGLHRGEAVRLGDVASVQSGYVSGANAHFHLSPTLAAEAGLPAEALVPALFRARALAGLRFTAADWQAAAREGAAGYLVRPRAGEDHPAVVQFLGRLRSAGVHRRYKARTRSPWYRTSRVVSPPLLLSAVGTSSLRLLVNDAGAAVPNTFHAVAPQAARRNGSSPAAQLAAAWLTSLTALSCELEGHPLGGGLLKLDPGEAGEVLLAPAELNGAQFDRLDRALRAGDEAGARHEADRLLLARRLGLSGGEIDRLNDAARYLADRRRRRGRD